MTDGPQKTAGNVDNPGNRCLPCVEADEGNSSRGSHCHGNNACGCRCTQPCGSSGEAS